MSIQKYEEETENQRMTGTEYYCYDLLGILTFDYQFGGRFDLAGGRGHPAGEQARVLLVGGADQQHGIVALGDHLKIGRLRNQQSFAQPLHGQF